MPAPPPRSPSEPTRPAAAPTTTTERGHGDAHATARHGTNIPAVPIGLGVGSLAAIAALQRARRIALRNRPVGRRPAPTPSALRPVEAGLRREAKRVDPIAATLRLAIALAGQRGLRAAVDAVLRHDDGRIELLLQTSMPAVAPFTTTDRGWQLPVNAAGFAFAVDDADPLPALLQLGRHDSADVYVDIEAAGYTALDGDPQAVEDLLATCAARLVGAPWAELTHVMIPARIGARVGGLEHVETIDDLAGRIDELLRYAHTVKAQLVEAGFDSVAVARGGGPADAMAVLTLVGWRQDELPENLVHAAVDPAVPLLLLAAGADERAGQQWRLTDEVLSGTAHADPVTVAARPPAADQVAVLIDHVRTADAVAPTDTSYVQLREDAPPAPVTEPTEPAMSIAVLGPVELTGIAMPRRTPAFQTLVYLALHRRGVTAEQLSTALWPDELAAGKTIRNRVAEARAVVEGAISDGPGWRLDEAIGSDWQRFQTLAAGTAEQQLAALDLVRGQPFDGFTDEWVDLEMFRTDMVAAVIDLAVTVAERALDDGEPAVAFRAARAGLRASPYEERLFRLAMRAADAEGSTGKLRALKNELQRVLDVQIEPDDRMQRETIALYEELTSAAHRRTRVGSVSVTPSG
jgi:DNA-binding SARP family transcriptional activator